METITIVVPCYNEEEVIHLFYRETAKVIREIPADFEFLFIDDGSSDRTLSILRELSSLDPRVKYVSFSRNFGKEAGIYAGLSRSRGDYVVLMDADLQHPPAMIGKMYDTIKASGCDSVAARRLVRTSDSALRRFFSRQFFRLMKSITKTNLVEGATDYRMMSRQMVDAVLSLTEYNRFTKGIFGWVGFRTIWLDYKDTERAAGSTKWSFTGLVRYSLDGIMSFSTLPLAFASVLGFAFCLISVLLMLYFAIKTWIIGGDPVPGFPTLICVIFLLGGIQLLCIGIMGQYMAKTYMEAKRRPLYIEKETNVDS